MSAATLIQSKSKEVNSVSLKIIQLIQFFAMSKFQINAALPSA